MIAAPSWASSRTWDGSTSSTCSLMRRRYSAPDMLIDSPSKSVGFRTSESVAPADARAAGPRNDCGRPMEGGARASCIWVHGGRGRFDLGGIRVQLLLIAVSAQAPAADM